MITHLFFPHFFEIASLGYYTVTIVNTQKVMTSYDAKRDSACASKITHRNRSPTEIGHSTINMSR